MAADGTLTSSLVTLLPLALGAFVLAGFLQSVSGFGAALVAVPLLAPPRRPPLTADPSHPNPRPVTSEPPTRHVRTAGPDM
ncbi:MAG: hypothetical protein ACO1ON_01305 [Nocardioides sp.]